jgi:group I intron endonuclease
MISGIYCIENKINGKRYIGESTDIEKRWKEHISKLNSGKHRNPYLQYSWNKYGGDSFRFFIIEECKEENLNSNEKLFIKEFSTMIPNGYNITEGGDGVFGYRHNEERRRKIKENTPKMCGEKHWNFGKHTSDNTKAKLRNAFLKEKSPVFGTKKEKSASKFFGVVINYHKQTKKGKEYIYVYWISQLKVDKKQYHLGYFKDEISAAKAYDFFVIENNLKNPLNFPEQSYKELENLKI